MQAVISISGLSKTCASGFAALKVFELDIRQGEVSALLGPNGAGKTTPISVVCDLVNPSAGRVTVGGCDIIRDDRAARAMIGLVPQELTTDAFETVWNTVSFSRGQLQPARLHPRHLGRQLRKAGTGTESRRSICGVASPRKKSIHTLESTLRRRALVPD
ncbi:MAG: ATP-binding cassette domain-containing protein [Proteobacteria bacterium]|nr:ATP-binding cassette domain-containing protein [Pseudomonadota bacterium]MBS0552439.1 ATP-binding cassette domain-containing protein [Pseudomonadota bacterium]